MITWRGQLVVSQRLRGWHLDVIHIRCRFEVYDSSAPEVALARIVTRDDWPLSALAGLTLQQMANLVLNTGLIQTVEIPGEPPAQGPPDPRPLREVGDEFLAEWNDSHRLLELPLPWVFGPR